MMICETCEISMLKTARFCPNCGFLQRTAKDTPKFKDKKEVPKADGKGTTTVYEYSERQIANRNREKAERIEKLRHSMGDLQAQVDKDIDAKDSKKRLTALAVALIITTFERVGNDESAEDGHYGVTGWLKEHLSFGKGKVTVTYVGKSGVSHEKDITDKKLVQALKGCCEDKKPKDPILSFGKEDKDGSIQISSQDVNEYLEPFDITAKDLRGLGANNTMQTELKKIRKAGPKLPTDKKEKEKLLKDEFKEALKATAEIVGHTTSILRSSYLVPGLEDQYIKDGTVTESLKKKAGDMHVFTYKGFHVVDHGVQEEVINLMLSGIDSLVAIFKHKGMEKLLREGVSSVHLRAYGDILEEHATYTYATKQIDVYAKVTGPGIVGRYIKDWITEVFMHEFGHAVHMNLLHPEARAEWDAAWGGVDAAKQALIEKISVGLKDRLRFFHLINENKWDVAGVGRKLKGMDRVKFLTWLYRPRGDEEHQLSKSSTRVVLTPLAKEMRLLFTNPDQYLVENIPRDLIERDGPKIIERRIRIWKANLGLRDESPEPFLNLITVIQIKSEDTSVADALAKLGIPSDYGKTNVKEDFAETFAAYMLNPSKLSETAMYRMKRALALSGLYGKPIGRLAMTSIQRVATAWLSATLSESEKEEREVERLSRPSPDKKPPRKDLRRERIDTSEEPRDKDLSMNYKDVGG